MEPGTLGMGAFTSRLLTPSDREAWDGLWDASERYLGLRWGWTEAAARGAGEAVRIGVFDGDGSLRAGLAFVARRNRWMTEWRHASPAPFAGLLHAEHPASESFLRDILSAAATAIPRDLDLAEVVFQPGLQDVRGLVWSGWEALPHYNYTSRFAGLEERVENAVRRQAAKAREEGAQRVVGRDSMGELLRLWDATRKRQRLPEHVTPEAIQALVHWLSAEGSGRLGVEVVAIAGKDGVLEAAALIGRDANRVYYLLGASHPDRLGSGAPTLLHFEVAALAVERGWSEVYDWVGANTPSIAQFKKKFRPELEVLMRVVRKRPRRRLIEDARRAFGRK